MCLGFARSLSGPSLVFIFSDTGRRKESIGFHVCATKSTLTVQKHFHYYRAGFHLFKYGPVNLLVKPVNNYFIHILVGCLSS